MKKEKISLTAASWRNRKIKTSYALIQAIFEFKSFTTPKRNFNQILKYSIDKKYKINTSPMELLEFFNVLKSLIRASFRILHNIDQYESKIEPNAVLHSKYLVYASGLTYAQYVNPNLLLY